VGFEPTIAVFELAKTFHASDRPAAVIGCQFFKATYLKQCVVLVVVVIIIIIIIIIICMLGLLVLLKNLFISSSQLWTACVSFSY
jgi:hypothetical protein